MPNRRKIIFFSFFLTICLPIWCCESDYVKINGECYHLLDLQFLQSIIENSQGGKNPPSNHLNPLELGWQQWENGRLVEFCCSTSTNVTLLYSLAILLKYF